MKALFLKSRSLKSLKLEKTLHLKAGDSVYFMGICGTAMASLAVELKKQGFKVSGSDQNIYPPMSLLLEKEKIPVFKYSADNIQADIKLIVVGNVISSSHIEIQKAKSLDIPALSLPELLQQGFLYRTKNIVIVGTHGKSSSAALTASAAKRAGFNPGFFVGAFPYDFNRSFRASSFLNQGDKAGYFVIEGDEYDSSFFAKRAKFFYYNPSYVILTGIEFDHGDIYKNLEEIERVFIKFLSGIPKHGALVACVETPSVEKILSHCKAPVLTYGERRGGYQIKNRKIIDLPEESDLKNSGLKNSGLKNHNSQTDELKKSDLKKLQQIEVISPDKKIFKLLTPLLGRHNALNALGVFVLARHLKWREDQVLKAFKNFKGLQRRLEFRFEYKGALIFEDFAHHPTAIQAGLSALRESYPHRRLIALFEPRSWTARSDIFQEDYVSAFELADLVFIANPYKSHKQDKKLCVKTLVADLKQKKAFCGDFKKLEQELKKQIKKGDLVVFMSSGAFGSLLEKLKSL